MKNLLLSILTVLVTLVLCFGSYPDKSETQFDQHYGIGKVKVEFEYTILRHKPYFLNFYQSDSENELVKTVEINWKDEKGGYVETQNAEFIKVKDFYLEEPHYILMFNCLQERNGFFEVIVNVDTKETLWIKKQSTIRLKLWDKFLKEVVCVSSLTPETNQIRVKPEKNSKIAIENNKDICWEVIDIQGEWLNVKCSEIFFDLTEEKYKNFNGWLRWRDDKELLIDYSLAY